MAGLGRVISGLGRPAMRYGESGRDGWFRASVKPVSHSCARGFHVDLVDSPSSLAPSAPLARPTNPRLIPLCF